MFKDDDGVMRYLISVLGPKPGDFTDDEDPMDIKHEPIRRNKAGEKKMYTKVIAKNLLSPARLATKCKVKGTKTKSIIISIDDEPVGDLHKHNKNEQPPANIMIKEAPQAGTINTVTMLPQSQSRNDDSFLSNPPPLTSLSASSSLLLCPSLSYHTSLSTDPLIPVPAPTTDF